MNTIDFNTQPDGFPLESDATLGFLQSNLADAVTAVAKLAGLDNIIVAGLIESAGTYSDGWIIYGGELLFFQGGTGSSTFFISQTVTQKANQNGAMVNRYFVRTAKFGSGTGTEAFNTLTRINTLSDVRNAFNSFSGAGLFASDWTILAGLTPLSGGTSGISNGKLLYQGRYMNIPTYNDGAVTAVNPVYLTTSGAWTTTFDAAHLKFSPYANPVGTLAVRAQSKIRDAVNPIGSIVWMDTTDLVADFFDGTGLGKFDWVNWAKANGNNGTLNLSATITGVTALQKIAS